jgi:hypothetical protein
VKLDNAVLVPASLLPFKAHWQRLANDLPPGEILLSFHSWTPRRVWLSAQELSPATFPRVPTLARPTH